jgi:putative transposase
MPQSLSFVLVHLVFSTKNRFPFIRPEDESKIHAFMGGIARDCRSPAYTVGGADDHVHLLCNLSRTLTVAKLLEELKSRSSKWLKTLGASYRDFHWQSGYGAFSIGRSQENALRA